MENLNFISQAWMVIFRYAPIWLLGRLEEWRRWAIWNLNLFALPICQDRADMRGGPFSSRYRGMAGIRSRVYQTGNGLKNDFAALAGEGSRLIVGGGGLVFSFEVTLWWTRKGNSGPVHMHGGG